MSFSQSCQSAGTSSCQSHGVGTTTKNIVLLWLKGYGWLLTMLRRRGGGQRALPRCCFVAITKIVYRTSFNIPLQVVVTLGCFQVGLAATAYRTNNYIRVKIVD